MRHTSPAELLATCQYKGLQPTLCARLLPQSTVAESNKDELISQKEIEKANHDRSAHDLPILPVGCIVTYFDHVSKTWLVGRIAQHTHDQAYLIETEAGRLISHKRCDIHRSHLTFVPRQPKLYQNHQSVQAEKPNPELVPVGCKPCIKQANASASHPTVGHHVSSTNSQAFNTFVLISQRGKSNVC